MTSAVVGGKCRISVVVGGKGSIASVAGSEGGIPELGIPADFKPVPEFPCSASALPPGPNNDHR